MTTEWLIKTPILQDEMFSSWLIRTALNQGCDPITMTGSLWPAWRIWTIDRDRYISNEKLAPLTLKMQVPTTYFKNSFLYPFISLITHQNLKETSIWPWLLAYGIRNRQSHAGVQYCPQCLKSDESPYFRLRWRFAWNTCCTKHNIKLLDRCSHCNKPIQLQQIESSHKTLDFCSKCLGKLSENYSPLCPINSGAIAIQKQCNRIVNPTKSEHLTLTNGSSAYQHFIRLKFIISLVRMSQRSRSIPLSNFMNQVGARVEGYQTAQTGLRLELLPTNERFNLLEQAGKICFMQDSSIIRIANKSNITNTLFNSTDTVMPRQLKALAELKLDKGFPRKKRVPRSRSLKPRSIKMVNRMHARLLRKMNID